MRLSEIKSFIGRNYHNRLGWRSNRKIVVIESDDWGSIRMPSLKVFRELKNLNIDVSSDEFTSYDSLASYSDLEILFETLYKHKDSENNPAVITANTIVANPNFEKIKESGYRNYFYENFTETLKRYSQHASSFELWKQGMSEGVFHPQLHGREHVNVALWLNHLRRDVKFIEEAFKFEMFGLSSKLYSKSGESYMAAFDYDEQETLNFIQQAIKDAQNIFAEIFGYQSKSFIAPNYIWSNQIENFLAEVGIKYIQSSRYQISPRFEKRNGIANSKHNLGEINSNNQIYLVRNCIFEPSLRTSINPVENTLKQVETSFFWKKPAIISSHRLNYIGYINQENRNKNIKYLDLLLKGILKKWPDVQFMTSDMLGHTIEFD